MHGAMLSPSMLLTQLSAADKLESTNISYKVLQVDDEAFSIHPCN